MGAEKELKLRRITCSVILIVLRLVSAYCQLSRNIQKPSSEYFCHQQLQINAAVLRIYKNFICMSEHKHHYKSDAHLPHPEDILIEVYRTESAKLLKNRIHHCSQEIMLDLGCQERGEIPGSVYFKFLNSFTYKYNMLFILIICVF